MGDHGAFATGLDHHVWLEAKRDEMELVGLRKAAYASKFENILGLIHTQSIVQIVGGNTSMSRLGNSLLFERPARDLTTARMIAEVFNPHPVLYSQEHAGSIGHEPQATQV